MADPHRAPAWLLWTLAGAVFCLDWLTKRWVISALAESHTRPILGDFVRFSYVRNPGVAFGLFADRGLPFSWVSVVALVAVVWLAFRPTSRHWTHAIALGLILGGALGNLFDRMRWGSVVDFLDVGVGGLRWWVFNVADASITAGVLLWAGEILLGRRPAHQPVGSPPGAGEGLATAEPVPELAAAGAAEPPGIAAAAAPHDDGRGA